MKKIFILFLLSICIIHLLANNAVVLKSTTSTTIKDDKKIEKYNVLIQVNNQRGDQYSSFQLPYSKNRKLKNLSGQITDVSGNILHKLSKKEIKTSSRFSNSTFYNDNFIKRFTLKHNEYPYIVEYKYSYQTNITNNQLMINGEYHLKRIEYPPTDYLKLQKIMDKVINAFNYPIQIELSD